MTLITAIVEFDRDIDNYHAFQATITAAQVTDLQHRPESDPRHPDFVLMTEVVLPAIVTGLRNIGSISFASIASPLVDLQTRATATDCPDPEFELASLRISLNRRSRDADHWQLITESYGQVEKVELAQRLDSAIAKSLGKALGFPSLQCHVTRSSWLLELAPNSEHQGVQDQNVHL